jgi:hypothetical protein
VTTRSQTSWSDKAKSDAFDCAEHFLDELCQMWRDDRKLSTDLNNDYPDGDSYHHENHTDASYSLTEASAILEELDDYEETDDGLWEGLNPREAISAQAAYTYGNAVSAMWQELIEELQEELDSMQAEIEENPPARWFVERKSETGEWQRDVHDEGHDNESDAIDDRESREAEDDETEYRVVDGTDEDALEELVSAAGERYLKLYFALADMADADYGGMVGVVWSEAKSGEFTGAKALADAIQEADDRDEHKAQRIRAAVE